MNLEAPLVQARIAGFCWMVCVGAGMYGYFAARGTHAGRDAILIAGGAYLLVTILLYMLFRTANPPLAMAAAGFGLVGIATSGDGSFYFGVQCILVGCLILVSSLVPRTLGVLMVLAGIGQLFFLSTLLPAALAHRLAPVGYVTDGAGEIALALWLLFVGVRNKRAA